MFLDFTAVFDATDYSLLIAKLKVCGFFQAVLAWKHSYLSNVTQQVFFNGNLSKWITTSCGLSQGSSLGPLNFQYL